jgi:hypothetical protein
MDENTRVQTLLKAHRGVSDDATRVLLLQVVTASHKLLEALNDSTHCQGFLEDFRTERDELGNLIIFEDDVMPFESADADVGFMAEQIRKHGHGGS